MHIYTHILLWSLNKSDISPRYWSDRRRRYHKRLETSPYRTLCRADFLDDPRSLIPHLDTALLPPELRKPLGKRRRQATPSGGGRRPAARGRRDTGDGGGADDGAAEALLGEDGIAPVGLSADELRRGEGNDEDGGGGGGGGEAADGAAGEGGEARRGSDGEGEDWEDGEEEEGDMEMADYAVGKVGAGRGGSLERLGRLEAAARKLLCTALRGASCDTARLWE